MPAGGWLAFSPVGIATDPAHVQGPWEFRPERWIDESATCHRDRAAWPLFDHPLMRDGFGHGPRMCLGARVAQLPGAAGGVVAGLYNSGTNYAVEVVNRNCKCRKRASRPRLLLRWQVFYSSNASVLEPANLRILSQTLEAATREFRNPQACKQQNPGALDL